MNVWAWMKSSVLMFSTEESVFAIHHRQITPSKESQETAGNTVDHIFRARVTVNMVKDIDLPLHAGVRQPEFSSRLCWMCVSGGVDTVPS